MYQFYQDQLKWYISKILAYMYIYGKWTYI